MEDIDIIRNMNKSIKNFESLRQHEDNYRELAVVFYENLINQLFQAPVTNDQIDSYLELFEEMKEHVEVPMDTENALRERFMIQLTQSTEEYPFSPLPTQLHPRHVGWLFAYYNSLIGVKIGFTPHSKPPAKMELFEDNFRRIAAFRCMEFTEVHKYICASLKPKHNKVLMYTFIIDEESCTRVFNEVQKAINAETFKVSFQDLILQPDFIASLKPPEAFV